MAENLCKERGISAEDVKNMLMRQFGILLPDGSKDMEALEKYLGETSGDLDKYKTAVDEAGVELIAYWRKIYDSPAATEEQTAVAQANLKYVEESIGLMKKDAELQIVSFTDMLQKDLFGKTNQIIDENIKGWEEKGGFGRWIYGALGGADTEAAYVQEAVNKQVENIDKVSAAINEQLGNLETDGVVWASDAVREIYKVLFSFGDNAAVDRGLNGLAALTLNEEYKKMIDGATEGLSELTKERGKDATDGYASGFSDSANIQNAQNEVKSFIEKVLDTIPKTQDSGSPSKVTMALGKDATDGYAAGFKNKDNILNAQNAVSEFTSGVLSKFSEVIAPLNQIGIDAMQGLLNGLSSMETSIYTKADEIANNVANSVKKALDIHSPSRVMFALGDYTMQGFKEGMENLYNPITSSLKSFSYDVSVASASSLTDMYGGYQYQAAYTPQYGFAEYSQSGYNQNDSELKSLLRRNNELLAAILAKPNIGGREVLDVLRPEYQQESMRRFGNPSACDPIFGS